LKDLLAGDAEATKHKWYYNVWFVLFMLFVVVGPFGLPLVWKSPQFPRWAKILLTLVMILYTVLLTEMLIRVVRLALERFNQLNDTFQF
jgi:hypothetical protein